MEGFCGCSQVELHKRARYERNILIRGMITRERYERLEDGSSGALIASDTANNTIVNIDRIINLITSSGTGAGAHFSMTHATLLLYQGSGGTNRTAKFVGTSNNSPFSVTAVNANGARLRWEFWDESTNSYAANYARLYNGDPDTLQSAEDETDAIHISETNPAFGTKPSNENWRYHYEIEFYSTDTDLQSSGHLRMLQAIAGISSNHFNASNLRLQPKGSGGTNVGTPITASNVTRGTNYFEATFVSGDGDNVGEWLSTVIEHNRPSGGGWVTVRNGACRQGGTSCGTKASGEEWTYVWRYTLSSA